MFGNIINIEVSIKDLREACKQIKARLFYSQEKQLAQLQRLHTNVEEGQSEGEMFRKVLYLLHHYLPPCAQDGWISVQHFDQTSGRLLPIAIYPPFQDPDMHARVSHSLTYNLNDPDCRGLVATCARKALEWMNHPSATYPAPLIVHDVQNSNEYRLIDPDTKSEAAVAVSWGSQPLAILNFEAKRKWAFKNMEPLLNGIARTLERFYALYEASTLGCEHSIEQLLGLMTDPCTDVDLLLKQVCRIVATAVTPSAKVAYLGVWDGTAFSRDIRAWSISADPKIITPHLENLVLSSDGYSRCVLNTRVPSFNLRHGDMGLCQNTSSDETLRYILKAPAYDEKKIKRHSCCVLPLFSQGLPVGVLWLLFERGTKGAITSEEGTHLTCVANLAGSVVGTVLQKTLRELQVSDR